MLQLAEPIQQPSITSLYLLVEDGVPILEKLLRQGVDFVLREKCRKTLMLEKQDRLERERQTIQVMIEIYCRGHHHLTDALCPECQQLLTYAMQRLDKCPYQDDKPTCAKCPIHCYKPIMREQVRQVMRYAGPRMMLYHPLLTISHYVDEMTKVNKSKANVKRKN